MLFSCQERGQKGARTERKGEDGGLKTENAKNGNENDRKPSA